MYDETKLRSGQKRSLDTIIMRLRSGCSHIAIVMATRYGKSDLQRIAALKAIDQGLACCAISLSPNTFLCDQMDSEKKWAAFCTRLAIRSTPKHSRLSTCVQNPIINGEVFLSITMQFFQRNLEYFKDWAKAMYDRTGKPMLLFVDECHTQSTMNEWGNGVTDWQHHTSGRVVLCTATANRADGVRIPGFEYDEVDVDQIKVVKTRPGSAPEKVWIDIYNAEKKTLNLRAHCTTTFGEAWEENVLCQVEYRPFDVDLKTLLGGKSTDGMLSELENTKEIRRALSKAVRDPLVIDGAARQGVLRLSYFCAVDPTIAAIIFCGNDMETDGETNKHANQIKQALLRHDPALKIRIATSAEGAGAEVITQFAAGDAVIELIPLQMAGLGLDISRLKVGIDLSPVRTIAAVVQRMMRVATPHKNGQILVCSWITPNDLLSQAIFNSVVKPNGGEISTADLELILSYEKDKKEGPEKPEYFVKGVHGAGAVDTKENKAIEHEIDDLTKTLLAIAPEAAAFVTLPELTRRAKAMNGTPTAAPPQSENTGIKIQQWRDEINDLASTCIKSRRAGRPYSQQAWQADAKEVWRLAYDYVGVKPGTELKEINDLSVLDRLLGAFRAIAEHRI